MPNPKAGTSANRILLGGWRIREFKAGKLEFRADSHRHRQRGASAKAIFHGRERCWRTSRRCRNHRPAETHGAKGALAALTISATIGPRHRR